MFLVTQLYLSLGYKTPSRKIFSTDPFPRYGLLIGLFRLFCHFRLCNPQLEANMFYTITKYLGQKGRKKRADIRFSKMKSLEKLKIFKIVASKWLKYPIRSIFQYFQDA